LDFARWHAQDQAIARLPANPLHLPLQHPHLLAQGEHLGFQGLGVLGLELDQLGD